MSWATTNLKEAGGKHSGLRTETAYRRDSVGDVAIQTKAPYCTERCHVNAEATSIESGLSYSGRSVHNPSEVRESAEEKTTIKAGKAMVVWCRQKSAEAVVLLDMSPWKDGRSHQNRKG